ncbi:TonB-dependent receptor domain-containing protein [Niabella hibiscisoli]|uniref:TonB-dependent receptor domain-containing protein n=1 Tax=Niabella hibiscisoli TaxID=1825928 RepID=UPI001F0D055D|nr:TonB-dependent receptor [Niabella hibiscisoli]MCH5719793.1 TonB-dependent receptor [Niabella hibiscisoli]
MISYAKNISKNHMVQTNLRTELASTENRRKGFDAEGFPLSSNGNPKFAYGYRDNGLPSSAASISRRHSVVGNVFYSYKSKYNADVSVTYDGSTSFGQKNLYQPFTSFGASWNMNKEKFLENIAWIDNLKVRGSYGITGNQSFASTSSISTYNYFNSYNYFGQGVYLGTLGNPDLKWQNTFQTNLGLDATFSDGRFNMTLDAYKRRTDPLVLALSLPSSTALVAYPMNLGTLTTKGVEFNVRYAPIYKKKERVMWFIGVLGTALKGTYGGFNNRLDALNDYETSNNSLMQYRDGYDSYDLWAVPSLGIDPATGKEIFLKKMAVKLLFLAMMTG